MENFLIFLAGVVVIGVIMVVAFFDKPKMIMRKFHLCPHKATYIVYEEDIENGVHHTYRHYVCFECGKTVRTEQLQ